MRFLTTMLDLVYKICFHSWDLLVESAPYILFGILVGGLLKVFLSPDYVARHLGASRFGSVFKAAIFGIPLPLCSCGVLPAAASLKKQGANNGATTAFLISTPESGVDSISITYALLDPILTVARPLAAFATALTAGLLENVWNPPPLAKNRALPIIQPSCGCDDNSCNLQPNQEKIALSTKIYSGLRYAIVDLWGDLAGWFFLGVLLGGIITAIIPDDLAGRYLGGGLPSMLLMLAAGIPLYICATASTPIAAALILKGVSPGAALVFLLAGPATNVTSMAVLVGFLGRRSTLLYLVTIAVMSVIAGLAVDALYFKLGISATAVIGHAGDILPEWLSIISVLAVVIMSVKPLYVGGKEKLARIRKRQEQKSQSGCG